MLAVLLSHDVTVQPAGYLQMAVHALHMVADCHNTHNNVV